MGAATRSKTTRATAAKAAADPSARVLRRFRIVFNAVKSHFRAVESKVGVSGAQVWALSVIDARPGVGVGELARGMDVHQSTASNLVRGLVEAGLVVSTREGEDRRAVQLHLTARGKKALTRAPGPFAGVLPDALHRLDPKVLARLDRDLAKLIQVLGPEVKGKNVPLGDQD